MPRPRKDARLYLERRAGRAPQWVIRDGETRIRTGCGEDDRRGADEALADYLRRRWVRPDGRDGQRLLLRDVLALYGREVAPTRQDPARIGWAIKALLPFWGEKEIAHVTAQSCRRYVLDRGVSTGTARRELGALSAALRYAEAEGVIERAPRVSLPPPPPGRDKWLTRSDAAQLLCACRHSRRSHVARLMVICLYTGTRPGAALALSWRPHRAGGWIDVDRGLLHRAPADAVLSNKRQPPCPMPRQLVALCRIWRDADERVLLRLHAKDPGRQQPAAGMPLRKESLPVIHFRGRFVASVKTAFLALRRETGIDVTPHVLRHTAITWAMQRGVPIHEAVGYFGVSRQTMERVYIHHHPDHLAQARAAMERKR